MNHTRWIVALALLLSTLTSCYRVPIEPAELIDPELIGKWKGPALVQFGSEAPKDIVVTVKKQSATTYELTTDAGLVAKAQVAVVGQKKFLCVYYPQASSTTPWAIFGYAVQKADFLKFPLRDQVHLRFLNTKTVSSKHIRPGNLRASVESQIKDPKLFGTEVITYKKL
ncbi:MAG: hypothetical protein RL693_646 [Verrucomicrobiota bacterium]